MSGMRETSCWRPRATALELRTDDSAGRRWRVIETQGEVILGDVYLVWCGLELCETRSGTASNVQRYSQGQRSAQGLRYFVYDHLGSAAAATDEVGATLARFTYDAWGRRTVTGTPDSTPGFTGHIASPRDGLALAVYRQYDPELGRWISQDPVGLLGGANMMAYVDNNPVNAVDPLGLQTGAPPFPPPGVRTPPLPTNYPRPDKSCCDSKRREERIKQVEAHRQRMRGGRAPVGVVLGAQLTSSSCDPQTGWCTPWPPPPNARFTPNTDETDSCVRHCVTEHEWVHWNDRRPWRLSWSTSEFTNFREWPGYDRELTCLKSFR